MGYVVEVWESRNLTLSQEVHSLEKAFIMSDRLANLAHPNYAISIREATEKGTQNV